LRVPLSGLVEERQNADPANHTLERAEREHIISRVAGMHWLGLWSNRSGTSVGAEAEHSAVENAAAGNHSRRLQRSAARVGKLNPRATRQAEVPRFIDSGMDCKLRRLGMKKRQLIRLDGATLVSRNRRALEALALSPSPRGWRTTAVSVALWLLFRNSIRGRRVRVGVWSARG
jgi:hypothetical protein